MAQTIEDQAGVDSVGVMTDNQYAALVDFVYNEGSFGPTLRALLRARKFDSVPPELARYVYAHLGGKVVKLQDLVRRRNAEIELWSTGEPGVVSLQVSSGALQGLPTPPGPVPPPPHTRLLVSSTAVTAVLAAAVAAPQALSAAGQVTAKVVDATAPLAGNATVDHVRGWLIAAMGLMSALAPLALWMQSAARRAESDGAPGGTAQLPPSQLELPLTS